jgi:uncharacterized membrane protein YqhA
MNKLLETLEHLFETFLFNVRIITLTAVIGSLVSSIIMFIKGSVLVCKGLLAFIETLSFSSNAHGVDSVIPLLISSVDNYLFATVLLIFSMGLYELFISKLDPASRTEDSRPNWLQVSSLDDLKGALGKVILMILIVSFFEQSLEIEYHSALDLLYLGIGILLVSAALFLTHVHSHKPDHTANKH